MTDIDFATELGARALARLESEEVIWLTTVSARGIPQPSPVWFLWHDDHLVIYSQPNTPKVRAIQANPNVALNFNASETGGDVAVFRGTAEVLGEDAPANTNQEYITKYAVPLERLGYTAEGFAAEYSVLIRVTPTRLRGFE
jgi:PPOX class probable F420-dependent enzyme